MGGCTRIHPADMNASYTNNSANRLSENTGKCRVILHREERGKSIREGIPLFDFLVFMSSLLF